MNKPNKTYSITELAEITGLDSHSLHCFLHREWLIPIKPELFDEQDMARAWLIKDLQQNFGVNEEAVPLILHLIDQLCFYRDRIGQMEVNKS